MNIGQLASSRYTTKAYDPGRKIAPELIEQLETLLHLAPSSVNSQPWHFFIAESDAAKAAIASAATGHYSTNQPRIVNASHVVVFCVREELDDNHLERVLDREESDGRLTSPEARAAQQKGRGFYINLHRNELQDTRFWMERQVYIALGALLFGAAALGVDSTPIEGFDRDRLDEALALKGKGWRSVVIASLGYRSVDDVNADTPKSRLSREAVITRL